MAAEARDAEQEAARIAVEVDEELKIPATPACVQIPKTIPVMTGKVLFARMPAVVTHSECDTALFGSNNIALTRRSGSDSRPGASNSEDESSCEETGIVYKPPSEEGGEASQEHPDNNSAGGDKAGGAPVVCSD